MRANQVLPLLFALFGASCAPITARHVTMIDNRVAPIQPVLSIPWIKDQDGLTSCVAFSPDGNKLLVADSEGKICIWNVDGKPQNLQSLIAGSDSIEWAQWSHDGHIFITCGRVSLDRGENVIRFWDADAYRQTRLIRISSGSTITNSIYNGGSHASVAAFSLDDSLLIWSEQNDNTGETHIIVLSLQNGERTSAPGPQGIDFRDTPVFISPDQRHVYWRNMMWDIETKPQLALTNPRKFTLPIFAYSADGRWGYVVEALYPGDLTSQGPMVDIYYPEALYRFDLSTGQIETRWEFTVPRKAMHGFSTTVSPDGKLVAIASQFDVNIIDVEANQDLGRCVKADLASNIRSLSFSPDGKRLAGRTTLGAYIWEVPQGTRDTTHRERAKVDQAP